MFIGSGEVARVASGEAERCSRVGDARSGAELIGFPLFVPLLGLFVGSQMIDHVRSFSPRGWSCLHLTEGAFDCYDATITNKCVQPLPPDAPPLVTLPLHLPD